MLKVVSDNPRRNSVAQLYQLGVGDVFCFPGVGGYPKLSEPHLRLRDKFVRLFGDFAVLALDNVYASYDVYKLEASLEVSL